MTSQLKNIADHHLLRRLFCRKVTKNENLGEIKFLKKKSL